jgi:uncharacterized protein DUF3300
MNPRKTLLATLLAAAAVTPLAVTPLQAQAQVQQAPQHVYTQAELDQMLAPIALYPDNLLSQVLMASTYPIEVVEAARWSRANPGLTGDAAVRAVQNEDWDPSVKSLVAFPEILQRMDEKLEWTRSLGDAFLAQENQLMDRVQLLRQRAETAGSLRSDEQIRVVREGPIIVIRPARPEYIYVPYYDPLVVYGPWWWADYRPVYWAPWPGYVRPRPSYAFWWGRPIGVSVGFFFGDFDWYGRQVRIAYANSYYYRQPRFANSYYAGDRSRWYHDSFHRRGVDYRNTTVRQRFSNEAYVLGQHPAETGGRRSLESQAITSDRQQRREELRRQGFGAQAQPGVLGAQQPRDRTDNRQELREQRRAERQAERQVQPQVAPQLAPRSNILGGQPAFQRPERQVQREERQVQREERRVERQAAPQPQAAPRQHILGGQPAFQRPERQERQVQREERRVERQQPSMPAAQAPQTPRAVRQERREERHEQPRGAAPSGGGYVLGQHR